MPDFTGPRRFHVTERNMVWVSEEANVPLAEVRRRYEEAQKADVVCVITERRKVRDYPSAP